MLKSVLNLFFAFLITVFILNPCNADDSLNPELKQYYMDVLNKNWHYNAENYFAYDYAVISVLIYKKKYYNKNIFIGSSKNNKFNYSVKTAFDNSIDLLIFPDNKTITGNFISYCFLFYNTLDKNGNKVNKIFDFGPNIIKIKQDLYSCLKNEKITNQKPGLAKLKITFNRKNNLIEKSIKKPSSNEDLNQKLLLFVSKKHLFEQFPEDLMQDKINIIFKYSYYPDQLDGSWLIQSVSEQVSKHMTWLSKRKNNTYAKVYLRINKDGKLLKAEIFESSGNSSWNEDLMDSIFAASPFCLASNPNPVDDYYEIEMDVGDPYSVERNLQKKSKQSLSKYTKKQKKFLQNYLNTHKKKIKKNIKFTRKFTSLPKTTKISIIVDKNGNTGYFSTYQPSGNNDFDKAVANAVKNTKFEQLPEFVEKPGNLNIIISFRYKPLWLP